MKRPRERYFYSKTYINQQRLEYYDYLHQSTVRLQKTQELYALEKDLEEKKKEYEIKMKKLEKTEKKLRLKQLQMENYWGKMEKISRETIARTTQKTNITIDMESLVIFHNLLI